MGNVRIERELTEDVLREMYEEHDEIGEAVRDTMRDEDATLVYDELDALRDVLDWQVDAWDNVTVWPAVDWNECGTMARVIRNSPYSYPSTLEVPLHVLEILAGYADEHWADAEDSIIDLIERAMKEACRLYSKELTECMNSWMDYDDETLCGRFMEEPEMWLRHVGLEHLMYEDAPERELGTCPECGSHDTMGVHETVEGQTLRKWAECCACGHRFVEVFALMRVETWEG